MLNYWSVRIGATCCPRENQMHFVQIPSFYRKTIPLRSNPRLLQNKRDLLNYVSRYFKKASTRDTHELLNTFFKEKIHSLRSHFGWDFRRKSYFSQWKFEKFGCARVMGGERSRNALRKTFLRRYFSHFESYLELSTAKSAEIFQTKWTTDFSVRNWKLSTTITNKTEEIFCLPSRDRLFLNNAWLLSSNM